MPNESLIRCEVYCQKGRQYSAAFPLGGGYSSEQIQIGVAERAEDGCRIGSVRVWLQNNYNTESWNLRLETPVKVWLPFPRPEAMTALYLLNEWWTRPAFVSRFEDIPDRTQVLLMRYPDRCGCFVPMVGRAFKAILGPGTAGALALAMQSGTSGARELDEPLYLYAEGATLAEAVRKAFRWLAGEKNLRLRAERRIPEMLRYLGWCSWDAFYREVSEAGIRQKAEELRAKEVPVRWMMIDDGWFKAEENVLLSMTPDPAKFPQGFGGMVRDLREKYGVRWVGVWHTLAGFWGGLQPGSAPAEAEKAYLCRSASGKILPSPVHGAGFYRDWYDLLRRQGIRFVKVDGQSSTACHFENTIPLAEAAAGLGRALEEGSAAMDGDVINCMGMAMETILALGSPTINEFASFMRISSPNAAYKINSLIRKGYIEKIKSEHDKREYHLHPTQKYLHYYNISNDYVHTVMERIQRRFSPADCEKIEEMLAVIDQELMPEIHLPSAER